MTSTKATHLRLAGKFFGLGSTAIDAFSVFEDFNDGDYVQGGLDMTSAGAGAMMFFAFEATAPVSIPLLAASKLMKPAARHDLTMRCMGADMNLGMMMIPH